MCKTVSAYNVSVSCKCCGDILLTASNFELELPLIVIWSNKTELQRSWMMCKVHSQVTVKHPGGRVSIRSPDLKFLALEPCVSIRVPLGKQSHQEWYGLRFRPSTTVWAGDSVSNLCLKGLQVRMTWSWDGKTGCQVQKTKSKLEFMRTTLTCSSFPTSNLNDVGDIQEEVGNLLRPTAHVLGRGHRAGRRRGAGAKTSEAQLRPLTRWRTSRSAPAGQLGPCCGPVGVMALTSLLLSKPHRNVFCSQLYLTQIINR